MEVRVTFVRKLLRIVLLTLAGLGAAFVALVVYVAVYQPTSTEGGAADPGEVAETEPEPEPEPELPSASAARQVCQQFITRSLNDPDSVEWVDEFDWPAAETQANVWLVRATFRARNSFNALILLNYECEVSVTGEDWFLVRLDNLNL